MDILIPVGLGELYDKISILEIKKERITDLEKLAHVRKELSQLEVIAEKYPIDGPLYNELKAINEVIWNNVGQQWDLEVAGEVGQEVIELARQVYINNDKRAEIKRKINLQYGSGIVEVKQYNKK
jgi:hypothetical protein